MFMIPRLALGLGLLGVVGMLGCKPSRDLSEYHFACYSYETLNTEGTRREVTEYPCKVKHERLTTTHQWEEVRDESHSVMY